MIRHEHVLVYVYFWLYNERIRGEKKHMSRRIVASPQRLLAKPIPNSMDAIKDL